MRYVLADLEQAGQELARHADEVARWLDAAAVAPSWPDGDHPAAEVVGLVDLACYQALSAAERRLRAAAGAMLAGLADLREVDHGIAGRIVKGEP